MSLILATEFSVRRLFCVDLLCGPSVFNLFCYEFEFSLSFSYSFMSKISLAKSFSGSVFCRYPRRVFLLSFAILEYFFTLNSFLPFSDLLVLFRISYEVMFWFYSDRLFCLLSIETVELIRNKYLLFGSFLSSFCSYFFLIFELSVTLSSSFFKVY